MKIKNFLKKYYFKISNLKYKRNLKQLKSKLYINTDSSKKYISSRRKDWFKFLKTKLQFDNGYEQIKKLNLYYYLIWLFLILSTIYIVVFSHYFSVKKIDIIWLDETININLAYKSAQNILYTPLIFVDKEKLKNNIIANQPNLKNISIYSILPDTIKITAKSYESNLYFKFDKKAYEITENWVFVPTNWHQEKSYNKFLINIKWLDTLWYLDYKKMLSQNYIQNINLIIKYIKEKNSFIKIDSINYYKKEAELHIKDISGTILIFDLNKDINIQIQKLNIFYKKYYSKIKLWIIYLDLRINEKIIYCPRSSEFDCKENLRYIYN